MHEKLRKKAFHALAHFLVKRPWTVLIAATVLAAICVIYTVSSLTFKSNRNDLISPDLAWNKRFIDWQTSFAGSQDLVVVVDTKANTSKKTLPPATKVVDALVARLKKNPTVKQLVWGFEAGAFSPKAIQLLPITKLASRLERIKQAKPIFQSPTLGYLIRHANQKLKQGAKKKTNDTQATTQAIEQLKGLTQMVLAIDKALQVPIDKPLTFDVLDQFDQESQQGWHYLKSDNGRLLFIRITPQKDTTKLNAMEPAIRSIRQVIASVRSKFPYYDVGLTGIEVVEMDETQAATFDSAIASAAAFVLITILLMTAFHSVRGPLLAMASLLIGMAWCFGFLTLAVGHLQVLSVIFTVILLGLGIDYGIHLASSFERVRHDHDDSIEGFTAALQHSFETTGPGVLTGAITTAAAFMTTLLTDFTGVAEMGLIAGVGVLLCLLAMFTVYPVLLRLVKPSHKHFKPMDNRSLHLFEERWVLPFVRHPRVTVVTVILLTLGAGSYVGTHLSFDYDLLKLQPANAPGVNWSKRIAHDGGAAIYYGISVADNLSQAKERAKALVKLPTVMLRLGGVGLLIPANEDEKLAMIGQCQKSFGPLLSELPHAKNHAPKVLPQLGMLRFGMQLALFKQLPTSVRTSLETLTNAIDHVGVTAKKLGKKIAAKRIARLNLAYQVFRQKTWKKVQKALDASPLTIADFPASLMRTCTDAKGRLTLEIYPKLANHQSPLDPTFLTHFVGDMKKVDPNVTGVVVQIYESSSLIKNAYISAGKWALLIVFLLVLIDFRSVHDAALALMPVAIGFTLTFAIMRLMGMTINPANIIVLPLMFGIGVDAGVHVLHRYRLHPNAQPLGLTHGTGKGITITTLTTVIGFACLLLAQHRGIRSIGFIMSLGVLLTMFACWIFMPAWLTLRASSSPKKIPKK